MPTQLTNLFDEKISLPLQRTDRGGTASTTSSVKKFLSGKKGLVVCYPWGRVELSVMRRLVLRLQAGQWMWLAFRNGWPCCHALNG